MIHEVWRPVVGYEGIYSVSDLGRVRKEIGGSNCTYVGKILKTNRGHWYQRLTLTKNGKQKPTDVHVLVMTAFVGPRPTGYDINHIDGNKSNCRLSNLEYCTRKRNNIHAYESGLKKAARGSNHHSTKFTDQDVLNIREEFNSGKISRRNLATKYSVSYTVIDNIVRNRLWKHLLPALAEDGKK